MFSSVGCAAIPMLPPHPPPPQGACHAHAAALGAAPHPALPIAQSFVHAAAALEWIGWVCGGGTPAAESESEASRQPDN
jgi:hypothetical protein